MIQRELINGIYFQKMDAKLAMADASYQWIDIDPFGSPVAFIDSAIQSLARTGMLEVTATDTLLHLPLIALFTTKKIWSKRNSR